MVGYDEPTCNPAKRPILSLPSKKKIRGNRASGNTHTQRTGGEGLFQRSFASRKQHGGYFPRCF